MEPLSIAESAIAILGAITASGKGIKKLLDLRRAPEEVLGLSNEAQSMQAVLLSVQQSLSRMHGSNIYHNNREALSILLSSVEESVVDLERIIEIEIKRAGPVDRSGNSKISRRSFLKAEPEIKRVRERIRDARINLIGGLLAMNLEVGEVVRRVALEIQSVTIAAPSGLYDPRGRFLSLQSVEELFQRERGRPNQNGAASFDTDLPPPDMLPTSLESFSELARGLGSDECHTHPDIILVRSTVRIRPCARFCKCSCHVSSHIRSPRWLRLAFGQLMFSYTNLFRSKPCNYMPCRQSPGKAHLTYMFPRWLASRALIASYIVGNLNGSTASWATGVPEVLPVDHRVWKTVAEGNVKLLQTLFASGEATPAVVSESGSNLLHWAAAYGQANAYHFLRTNGVSQHSENQTRATPAETALLRGNIELSSHDIETVADGAGFTPLHTALVLSSERSTFSDEFIDHNHMFINAKDKFGMVPVLWAARKKDLDAIRLLVKWEADLNVKSAKGKSVLHEACAGGDLACVRLLLEYKCDVNLVDQFGKTALFYLPDNRDSASIVGLLASDGANLNHKDSKGRTALIQAAILGHHTMIDALVKHGADISEVDSLGNSPLLAAVSSDKIKSIRALLKASSDYGIPLVWNTNHDGENALHLAALYSTASFMVQLAGDDLFGIDPEALDRNGNTPSQSFEKYRSGCCGVEQKSVEIEESAWSTLLTSVCRQNGFDTNTEMPVNGLDV